nr:hypothetical protein [uncultured Carboxylicivirga sp.]
MKKEIIHLYNENKSIKILWWIFIVIGCVWCIIDGLSILTNYINSLNVEAFKIIIQIGGGSLIFYGLILNKRRTQALEKQVSIAEDSNVTDRFQKAIEHLAHKNPSVRQGGIHSLGRIASESIKKDNQDWKLVIDILSSYLQNYYTDYVSKKKSFDISVQSINKYFKHSEIGVKRVSEKYELSFNNIHIFPLGEEEFVNYVDCNFRLTIGENVKVMNKFSNCSFHNCTFHLNKMSFEFRFCRCVNCKFIFNNDKKSLVKQDSFRLHFIYGRMQRCSFISAKDIFSDINFHKTKILNCKFQNIMNHVYPACELVDVEFKDCKFNNDTFWRNLLFNVSFENNNTEVKRVVFDKCDIRNISGLNNDQIVEK